MPIHIVMDQQGDTRHCFELTDREALANAESRFRELSGKGFRAVALGKEDAPSVLLKEFDPTVEQTLFIPQLQGG
jgi:hypothetical protein